MPADIIIVEDDLQESWLLEKCFKDNNYHKVMSFDNAFSFISYIKNANTVLPKVVILDYNMPQISGFQLLAFLKHNLDYASINIIIYSGFNDDDLKIRCLKAGAMDFIMKLSSYEEMSGFALKAKELAMTGHYKNEKFLKYK